MSSHRVRRNLAHRCGVARGVDVAQQIKRLTDRQIKTITKPGRHADGGGLYLVVDKSGAKRWAMLVTVNGRRREYGLGSLLGVDVVRARELAQQTREAVARGEDPRRQKQAAPTFRAASEIVIDEQAPGWRGRDTKAHWERSLYVYAKDIGKLPVDVIETDDVLSVVRPLWKSRPESGRKLRQRIETVLDVAAVRGWRQGANPARLKGHLDKLLPRQSRVVQHRRAVPYEQAPAVMEGVSFAHMTDKEVAQVWDSAMSRTPPAANDQHASQSKAMDRYREANRMMTVAQRNEVNDVVLLDSWPQWVLQRRLAGRFDTSWERKRELLIDALDRIQTLYAPRRKAA